MLPQVCIKEIKSDSGRKKREKEKRGNMERMGKGNPREEKYENIKTSPKLLYFIGLLWEACFHQKFSGLCPVSVSLPTTFSSVSQHPVEMPPSH